MYTRIIGSHRCGLVGNAELSAERNPPKRSMTEEMSRSDFLDKAGFPLKDTEDGHRLSPVCVAFVVTTS